MVRRLSERMATLFPLEYRFALLLECSHPFLRVFALKELLFPLPVDTEALFNTLFNTRVHAIQKGFTARGGRLVSASARAMASFINSGAGTTRSTRPTASASDLPSIGHYIIPFISSNSRARNSQRWVSSPTCSLTCFWA